MRGLLSTHSFALLEELPSAASSFFSTPRDAAQDFQIVFSFPPPSCRSIGMMEEGEGGIGGSGGSKRCDSTMYRLASDTTLMFSQENAGVPPLHAVRLSELSSVEQEMDKKAVETLRVAEATRGNADAAGDMRNTSLWT